MEHKESFESNYSSKRIFKNTLFLYLRQIVSLAITLYTSRVTLDVLGIDDYGLYNVIAGIVVLLSLVNNSMVSATQRFLTYEIGRGDVKQVSDTFSMSMTVHLLIGLFVLIIGESAGIYYIKEYLVVPEGRFEAAFWAYQISLLSIFVNIVRSPYQASIISYERMDFFAIISIADVLLKLLIVLLLVFISFDKLILYTLLILCINVLITASYRQYCIKKFKTCQYYIFIDRSYFVRLFKYLGWNVVGAFSTMGSQQVGNMIINRFVGVAINAAYGTAIAVSGALSSFLSNFQMAFQPQIVKLYAQNDRPAMFSLMNRAARFSYYLVFIIVAPLLFYIDYILGLWLKVVPPTTGIFCVWLFLTAFLSAIQCPLWISIGATGNIKVYQIWQSLLWFGSVPLFYYCLVKGMPAYWFVIVRFFIALSCTFFLLVHVRIQIGFPVMNYLKDVLLQISIVSIVYLLPMVYIKQYFDIENFPAFVAYYATSLLYIIVFCLLIGMTKDERLFIKQYLRKRINQKKY